MPPEVIPREDCAQHGSMGRAWPRFDHRFEFDSRVDGTPSALERQGLAMTSSSRSVEREPGGRPPVIHVVDDDPGFRAAIGDLLRACDYRVELYASATDLLEKPLGDEPACILPDVQ